MPTKIQDQNRGFKIWAPSEIYTGTTGQGAFVPNVGDAVLDWTQGWFKVVDVDYSTGLSTLQPHDFNTVVGGVIDADVLLGSGPGHISESYRLYVNTETVPFSAAMDARLRIYGSTAHHIKLFLGTDVGETAVPISYVPNTVNTDNIPLELVVMPGQNNVAVKVPATFKITEPVSDGELVTAVVYASNGTVLSICKMIVKLTDFIRTTDASQKMITGIQLLSPFMSQTDNHLLEYPINLPVQSGSLKGRVLYDDNSFLELNVDGTKFSLLGMDSYIASNLGQTKPLVLTYLLSNNEYSALVEGPSSGERYLSEEYTLRTVEAQGVYTVKIFVVPKWITTGTPRWALDFYLYNLDRDQWFLVTPYVEYGALSPTFDGQSFAAQELTVAVNLNQLGASYGYFRHVQTFTITMNALGNINTAADYYTLEYTDGNPVFGTNLKVIGGVSATPGMYTLDISCGKTDKATWLEALYNRIEAIYSPSLEVAPPTPNYVRVKIGTGFTREVELAEFDNLLNANRFMVDLVTINPTQGTTVRFEFIKRTVSGDQELGTCGVIVQRP